MSSAPRRNRHDLLMIACVAVLLCSIGGIWMVLSGRAAQERDRILEHTPDFPEAIPSKHPAAPRPARAVRPARTRPADAAKPARKSDPIANFAAHAGKSAFFSVVKANALLNAPLIARLDKCFGDEERELANGAKGKFDPMRDIDQVIETDRGEVATGSFGSFDDPAEIGHPCPGQQDAGEYRGFHVFNCYGRHGVTQFAMQDSTFISANAQSNANELIDAALDPPPEGTPAPDLSGDMVMRLDLTDEKPPATPPQGAIDQIMASIQQQASGITVRANVWDSLALSIDAEPRPGASSGDIATSVRGLFGAVRQEIDPDDLKLSALADLADVGVVNGNVRANVAVPADAIVDRMNAACEDARRLRAQFLDGGMLGGQPVVDPSDGGSFEDDDEVEAAEGDGG